MLLEVVKATNKIENVRKMKSVKYLKYYEAMKKCLFGEGNKGRRQDS